MSVNEKMTAIADAIRDKTGGTEKLGLDAMAVGVGEVYEAGKQAQYDAFWDDYQENGKRTNYRYSFCGRGWTDENFKPKYTPIVLSGNVYDISVDSKISAIDESHFDCSGATVLQQFFTSNVSGKPATVIMNVASCTALTNGFIYSANLETVELKNIRENCTFQNTFLGCSGLVNFRCSGTIGKNISFVNSNLLSNESVQIIIGHLKDLTGQAAQTLTLHPTVGAKLTNEQKTSVSAKNWTLVY